MSFPDSTVVTAPAFVDLEMKNNIIRMNDPDDYNTCLNRLSTGTASLVSDYNCFYGSGTYYRVAALAEGYYTTLVAWKSVSGQDVNSIETDPGFVSTTDLHIDPYTFAVDGAGISVPWITEDLDGELREDPPDIGADEYTPIIDPISDLVILLDPILGDIQLMWTALPGSYKL